MGDKSDDSSNLKGKSEKEAETIQDDGGPKAVLATDDPLDNDIEARRRAVESYTPEEASRTLRKVDYRLVPMLAFLYLLSFIDRGNSTSIPRDSARYTLRIIRRLSNILLKVCLPVFYSSRERKDRWYGRRPQLDRSAVQPCLDLVLHPVRPV